MSDTKQAARLGFGMMRLPRKGPFIDIAETSKMVDTFLEAGFNHFDTAFVYPGSEKAVRKALVERHPRESFTLATKMHAVTAPSRSVAESQFSKSLAKTGAGYFDYYLLHALMDTGHTLYDRFHLWDFVAKKKQDGLIRHMGFSFHGSPKVLRKLLTEHPEAEFVLLQINYADWNDPKVDSRSNYEVAREFGLPVMIMEPVKGGRLANPPEAVKRLLREANPDASYASWALRFAASLDGVITVLSGMSTLDQVKDNTHILGDLKPLSAEERAVISRAQEELGKAGGIPCTACGYCLPECPQKIVIPEVFEAMNLWLTNGQLQEAESEYAKAEKKADPASCLECGRCERVCPQSIGIRQDLKDAVSRLGSSAPSQS